MNKSEFNNLALRWEKLNNDYDLIIQKGFQSPEITEDVIRIESLKAMQQELYDLETTWFKVMQGEIKIIE